MWYSQSIDGNMDAKRQGYEKDIKNIPLNWRVWVRGSVENIQSLPPTPVNPEKRNHSRKTTLGCIQLDRCSHSSHVR